MRTFKTIPRTVQAVQWLGDNKDDILDLVGQDKIAVTDSISSKILILTESGWRSMDFGWWVTVDLKRGNIRLHTREAFVDAFEEI